LLTRRLQGRADVVVGLDRDRRSIEWARAQRTEGVRYVLGDLAAPPLAPESFDQVSAVASLHHGDARTGLRGMAGLVRPGGALVVVGLARSQLPGDLLREVAAAMAHRWLRLRRTLVEQRSPVVWPPPETYPGMRRLAAEVLPRWSGASPPDRRGQPRPRDSAPPSSTSVWPVTQPAPSPSR
jgi:SAM-dependent methyltransferase